MCKHNKHCNMLRGLQHALLQYTTAKPWALFYSQGAAAKHWTRKPVSSLYHLLAPHQHSLIEGQSTKTRNHTSIRGKKLSSNFIWSCQFQAFSVSQHQINKFTINLSTHNHQQSCFAPGWDFAFLRRRRRCLRQRYLGQLGFHTFLLCSASKLERELSPCSLLTFSKHIPAGCSWS